MGIVLRKSNVWQIFMTHNIEKNNPEFNYGDIPKSNLSDQERKKAIDESRNVIPLMEWVRRWGSKKQKEKFLVQSSRELSGVSELKKEKERLIGEYGCTTEEYPRWCIHGTDEEGYEGVLFLIRPQVNDWEAALKLAFVINKLGGNVEARETQWHEKPIREPVRVSEWDL